MNALIASTVTENCCNFTALVTGDQADVAAGIGRQAAAGVDACAGPDDHAIAAIEGALDTDYPGRQEALTAAQGTDCARSDGQHSGGVDRAGDPRLSRLSNVS